MISWGRKIARWESGKDDRAIIMQAITITKSSLIVVLPVTTNNQNTTAQCPEPLVSMRLPLLLIITCLSYKQASSLSIQPGRNFVASKVAAPAAAKSALFSAATGMGSDENKEAPWTQPRLHNTVTFRSVAILGAISAAGLASPTQAILSAQATAALHLFSYATWFGTMAYTTFVLGITMFKNLPRQTFGKLQAKLFPKYFMLSSVMIILQVSAAQPTRWLLFVCCCQ